MLIRTVLWVQWAAGLCLLAMNIGYTIVFCSTLS